MKESYCKTLAHAKECKLETTGSLLSTLGSALLWAWLQVFKLDISDREHIWKGGAVITSQNDMYSSHCGFASPISTSHERPILPKMNRRSGAGWKDGWTSDRARDHPVIAHHKVRQPKGSGSG